MWNKCPSSCHSIGQTRILSKGILDLEIGQDLWLGYSNTIQMVMQFIFLFVLTKFASDCDVTMAYNFRKPGNKALWTVMCHPRGGERIRAQLRGLFSETWELD
jgi:hypothetical protein